MDIARPSNARQKRIRRIAYVVIALLAVLLITLGLSRLKPAAPGVERATLWVDTVKRGPLLREERGIGTLVPEDIRWIPATTQGQVERILLHPGTAVILDGGTTALAVARALPKSLQATVITHSPTVAAALGQHSELEIFLLGGRSICMWEGEVLQAGDTSRVYRRPDTLRVAQVFSDPPLNIVGIEKKNGQVAYAGGVQAPATGLYAKLGDGAYRVGFRAHQLEVATGIVGRHDFSATVTVTEITGSESFVHLNRDASNWVAVLQGVHEYEPGEMLHAALDPDNLFVFDAAGRLVAAPGKAFSSEVPDGSREENASKSLGT